MKKAFALWMVLFICFIFSSGKSRLVFANDYSVSIDEKLQISYTGFVDVGRIYAALYRDGRMIEVKSCFPEDILRNGELEVSFDTMVQGDQIKVLWWDEPLVSLCAGQETTYVPQETVSSDGYAFLYSAAYEDDKWGTNTVVSLMLLDTDNIWREYTVASKLTICCGGEVCKVEKEDFVCDAGTFTNGFISFVDGDYDGEQGVIRYELNKEGEISTLIIPENGANSEYTSYDAFDELTYDAESWVLGSSLMLSEETVIFAIKDGNTSAQENITARTKDDVLRDGEEYNGYYYLSEDADPEIPNCLLLSYSDYVIPANTRLFVVSKTGLSQNKAGREQKTLWGYTEGAEEKSIFIAQNAMMKDENDNGIQYDELQAGDVVVYTTNANHEIYDLQVLHTKESVLSHRAGCREFDEAFDYAEDIYGYIAEKKTNEYGEIVAYLSEYAFDQTTDVNTIYKVGNVTEQDLTGNVYYVDVRQKDITVTIADNLEDAKANNICLDENADTPQSTAGYFMYARMSDRDIVDIVVYIVDCENFDLNENFVEKIQYAFLYSAAYEDDKWGTNTVVSLMLLDTDNIWREYTVADKLTICCGGEVCKVEKEDFVCDAGTFTNGFISFVDGYYDGEQGVIRYGLNKEGEISKLIIPENGANSEYTSYDAFDGLTYDAESWMLGSSLMLSEQTIIFAVKDGDVSEQENITARTKDDVLRDGEEYSGLYYVFEDGDFSKPNCFVINYPRNRVREDTRFFIVSHVGEYKKDDDIYQYAISGYTEGSEKPVTYLISEDADFWYDDLSEGDVVALALDTDGEVCDLKLLLVADGVLCEDSGYSSERETDDKNIIETYGYFAQKKVAPSGVVCYDLSAYAFDENTDIKNVQMITRLYSNKINGSVYYVDLRGEKVSVTVFDHYDLAKPANIRFDQDGYTEKDGEGYFIYTKTVDGDMVDTVIYIVDCEGFDVDHYLSK